MKKKQVFEQYMKIMLILFIASMVIMFITPFIISTFEMEMFGTSISEKGIDYIIPKSEDELGTFLDEESNSQIVSILVIVMFVLPIIFGIMIKQGYTSKPKNTLMMQMLVFIAINFAVSVLYFLVCFFVIIKESDSYAVETQTFIAVLLQGVALSGFIFLKTHYQKVLDGTAKPLFMFGEKKISPERDELAQVELLVKYKELLDSGIITEEQFEAKKQELLTEEREAEHIEDNALYEESMMNADNTEEKTSEADSVNFKMKWYKFLSKGWMPVLSGYCGLLTLMSLMGPDNLPFEDADAMPDFMWSLTTVTSGIASVLFLLGTIFLRKHKKAGIIITYVTCFTPMLVYLLIAAIFLHIEPDFMEQGGALIMALLCLVPSLFIFAVNAMYFQKRLSLFEKLGKTKKQR